MTDVKRGRGRPKLGEPATVRLPSDDWHWLREQSPNGSASDAMRLLIKEARQRTEVNATVEG
ncbi:MAG: DUF2239 family protein [Candidatus Sericytochromatia bacterium]|nr:DUF2239 family protein [Candidatus Sericytochromatia bacterium]